MLVSEVMNDLEELTASQLLALHAALMEELRARGVTRSSNNPTGDLAEYLFCKAFGWEQAGNSNPSLDALDKDGSRYQIKGRRVTRHNKSRQLSAIRNLPDGNFDFLAAVLFGEDYSVIRAAIIPFEIVSERATYIAHTNSHKFMLRDDVWEVPDVRDVTAELRAIAL